MKIIGSQSIQARTRLLLSTITFFTLFFSPLVSYAEVSQDTMIEVFQRLDNLEKKTRELVGENEVLKHQLDNLKKTQKEGFLNVDERVDALREQIKTAKAQAQNKDKIKDKTTDKPSAAEKPATSKNEASDNKANNKKDTETVKPTQTASTKPQPLETKKVSENSKTTASKQPEKTNSKIRAPSKYEKETYQAAFAKMKKSPTAATQAFKEYIKMQPNSPLAANAQYWIAEIMYSHNNYKGAIQEFIKVLQKYKYSDKAPDAAIKLGYSFVALKNWNYARRTFEDVLKYFPKNQNAVNLAKKQLEKLTASGH